MENFQAIAPTNIASPENRTIRFPILDRTPLKETAQTERTSKFLADLQVIPVVPRVVNPQPTRPIGSTIIIGEYVSLPKGHPPPMPKEGEVLDAALEYDYLPAVITDSKYRIRTTNSKYMDMIWQLQCRWLNQSVSTELSLSTPTPTFPTVGRINGKVNMDLSQCTLAPEPGLVKKEFRSDQRFLCMVRIEWQTGGAGGRDRISVTCPCDVTKLFCVTKDYNLVWRFHLKYGEFGF